ncbi:MAG: ACT domain-containing protein, partial [Acidimicrobiales bacterium]
FDLVVAVRPLGELDEDPAGGREAVGPWTIAVHGADRTGIVHGVTAALAQVDGNVVDLSTHLVGGPDAPVYVMTLRVTFPAATASAAAEHVRAAAEALGVHCSVHPDEAELL